LCLADNRVGVKNRRTLYCTVLYCWHLQQTADTSFTFNQNEPQQRVAGYS
jgi:hypothetical protein